MGMKRIFFLVVALGLLVSACGTTTAKPTAPAGAAINPSPVSTVDLDATAAVMAQQTIAAMPTQTAQPSATPVAATGTPTATSTPGTTATETPNPVLLTLTATLGTGTPDALPALSLPTATIDLSTPTETPYPRTYGTMPPDLPAGKVYIANKAKTEATISLHCTTKEGYVTYIEYPVQGKIKVKAPAGYYSYVVWVGGKVYRGNFKLRAGEDAIVTIFKDHVDAK
jgi:hypothetical protein